MDLGVVGVDLALKKAGVDGVAGRDRLSHAPRR
jgi:hypothetical protein